MNQFCSPNHQYDLQQSTPHQSDSRNQPNPISTPSSHLSNLKRFKESAQRRRVSTTYQMPESAAQALAHLHESAQPPTETSMQFDGSFQRTLDQTEVRGGEEPPRCFVMGGRKIKRLSNLRWTRSPSPRATSPKIYSEYNSNAASPVRASGNFKSKDNNNIKVSSPNCRTAVVNTRTEKMAMTERAPRPADATDKGNVQVEVELANQDKSFKNWKKAKYDGTSHTPSVRLSKEPPTSQDDQPPHGDFALLSGNRRPAHNFVASKNASSHISSVEINRF